MNPRTAYVVHVIAYMILSALLLVGGTVVIGNVMTGAGIGLALFGVVLWGYFIGGMAMAYWDARLREMPARQTPPPSLDPIILDDYLAAPNRTIGRDADG